MINIPPASRRHPRPLKHKPRPRLHVLDRVVNDQTCSLWPSCACYQNFYDWQDALSDDERIFPLEQLSWAIELIWNTCCCMSRSCPDQRLKAFADRQVTQLQEQKDYLHDKIDRYRQGIGNA